MNIHIRLLVLLVLVCCFGSELAAQQLSLFTQYRENAGLINPAALTTDYLTLEQNISIGATYRKQWSDFPGSPETQILRGSYFFDPGSGVGLIAGGSLINDQTGPTGFTGIYGRIAGVLTNDAYYGGISAGLTFGMVQYNVDPNELRFRDQTETYLGLENASWSPDVGLGIYAYKRIEGGGFLDDDVVYGGISVPQLLGLDLTFQAANGEFSTKRIQHYYAMVGFYKFFRNEGFLEPSVWVKYVEGAEVNVDINLRYQMATNFWIGAGGATSGTAHLEAGVLLGDNIGFDKTLKIGYGYDYSFNTFGPNVGPTHEININYAFEY